MSTPAERFGETGYDEWRLAMRDYTTEIIDGVTVHKFAGTSGDAYDASQTDDDIDEAHVLYIPAENDAAVFVGAWPLTVKVNATGAFDRPIESIEDTLTSWGKDPQQYQAAIKVARSLITG